MGNVVTLVLRKDWQKFQKVESTLASPLAEKNVTNVWTNPSLGVRIVGPKSIQTSWICPTATLRFLNRFRIINNDNHLTFLLGLVYLGGRNPPKEKTHYSIFGQNYHISPSSNLSWHKEVPFPFRKATFLGAQVMSWSLWLDVYFTISNPDPSRNDPPVIRDRSKWLVEAGEKTSWTMNVRIPNDQSNQFDPLWVNYGQWFCPQGPWEDTPNFPFHPHNEGNSFINCWWNVRGIFQGYVGEILDTVNM